MASTQAYAATPVSFIAVKGSLLPPSPTVKLHDDKKGTQAAIVPLRVTLKGKAIGVASGTVYIPFINKYFRGIADTREYSNSADAILDLQTRHIDAMFNDITFANATLPRPEDSNLTLSNPLMNEPIWGGDEAMGVRLTDTGLKAKPDSAIRAVLADGTVEKLGGKWFRGDVTP